MSLSIDHTTEVREMNTTTMVKKYEAKGYTMADLQDNWREHEKYGVTYSEWLQMMKAAVEQMPVKDW